MSETIGVEIDVLIKIINALKSMADSGRVTGYDNMVKIVSIVGLLNNILDEQLPTNQKNPN